MKITISAASLLLLVSFVVAETQPFLVEPKVAEISNGTVVVEPKVVTLVEKAKSAPAALYGKWKRMSRKKKFGVAAAVAATGLVAKSGYTEIKAGRNAAKEGVRRNALRSQRPVNNPTRFDNLSLRQEEMFAATQRDLDLLAEEQDAAQFAINAQRWLYKYAQKHEDAALWTDRSNPGALDKKVEQAKYVYELYANHPLAAFRESPLTPLLEDKYRALHARRSALREAYEEQQNADLNRAFEILNRSMEANNTIEEVNAAAKKLGIKVHPDRFGGQSAAIIEQKTKEYAQIQKARHDIIEHLTRLQQNE